MLCTILSCAELPILTPRLRGSIWTPHFKVAANTHQDKSALRPIKCHDTNDDLSFEHTGAIRILMSSKSEVVERKSWWKSVAYSNRFLLFILFALRLLTALCNRTFFQPDEYYQSLEPAWWLAFGSNSGAWMTWVCHHQHGISGMTDTSRNGTINFAQLSIRLFWRLLTDSPISSLRL